MSKKGVYLSQILETFDVAADMFVLRLAQPELAKIVKAGQFLEVHVPHCADVFWRRPFSVHDADPIKGTLDLLCKQVGKGTHTLKTLQKNEELSLLGPLGNSFTPLPNLKEAIMVAGGIGIAPFALLMRQLIPLKIDTRLFYGMTRKDQLCGIDLIQSYAELHFTTLDGSLGETGLVTAPLESYLKTHDLKDNMIFACGPTAMLREVQRLAIQFNISAQVSVETIMACGFGACVGCAVPLRNPEPGVREYALACKEGPVFNVNDIEIV